jgi:glycosyltransferase involved in cell wall biosynthesis
MKIAWLAPDDLGGGVVSVTQACCRQAALAGHAATLLLAIKPRGTHAGEFGGFQLRTLDSQPPHVDIPVRLIDWLTENPQDVIVFNGCEQADIAIPYVPQGTRTLSVIHDTAERYFAPAVRYEESQDGIVAVSETVADRFRRRLRDPSKLHVVLNGTVLPEEVVPVDSAKRADDIVFLGGEKPFKGAFDCLRVWSALHERGYQGRLHWFGEVGPNFLARIDVLPSRDRIVLYGRRPRLDIFQTAARSKAFLMLSRVESFGMATVECMGMGCLAVAWDIPTGTKEIVRGGAGYFAPLGDFDALAGCVMRAISEHAANYEATMRATRDDFSESAMWSRFQRVLDSITQTTPVSRPLAGRDPPVYRPPFRLFQSLPPGMRAAVREIAGRWPRLGFMLRYLRGR